MVVACTAAQDACSLRQRACRRCNCHVRSLWAACTVKEAGPHTLWASSCDLVAPGTAYDGIGPGTPRTSAAKKVDLNIHTVVIVIVTVVATPAIPAAPAMAVVVVVVPVMVAVTVAPAPVQQLAAAARGNNCIFRYSFLGGSVVCTGKHAASHPDLGRPIYSKCLALQASLRLCGLHSKGESMKAFPEICMAT